MLVTPSSLREGGGGIAGVVESGEDKLGLGECRDPSPRPSADGFFAMGILMGEEAVGEDGNGSGPGAGEPGRLANELLVGVMGVLDGLGPGSADKIGKLLNIPASLLVSRPSPPSLPMPPFVSCPLICSPFSSSSSSMLGKLWLNSDRLYVEACGEFPGDDVGLGGPNDDRGTKACGDGVVELDAEPEADEEPDAVGCDGGGCKEEWENRVRRAFGDIGGVEGVVWPLLWNCGLWC